MEGWEERDEEGVEPNEGLAREGFGVLEKRGDKEPRGEKVPSAVIECSSNEGLEEAVIPKS